MKIVIIGAAGNVGSHTTTAALRAGHDVTAFVRRPQAVPPRAGLTVVQGDASDAAAIAAASAGADIVIVSVTGSMKDAGFMQRILPPIIQGVRDAGAGRLVLVSAFGAGDTATRASGFARLIYRTVLAKFFGDKAAADRMLAGSGLAHTIAYPVNLKDGASLGGAAVVRIDDLAKVPGLPTLPFVDVADALVTIAEDASLTGARVVITTAKGWVGN